MSFARAWFLSLALSPFASSDDGASAPTNLRVEWLREPLGLTAAHPRFSWELVDPGDGALQTSYRVLVAEDAAKLARGEGDVWDSGEVASPATDQIEFAGRTLESFHRYVWKIESFDAAHRASPWSAVQSFGTGPLSASDWTASWIGDPTPLATRKRANNGYHSRLADREDAVKWVQLDLGEALQIEDVVVHPARPFDWSDTPDFLLPREFVVLASNDAEFERDVVTLGHWREEEPSGHVVGRELRIPAAPARARYVRLQTLRLARRDASNFGLALAELEVRAIDGSPGSTHPRTVSGKASASDSLETGAWSLANLNDGDTQSHGSSGDEPRPAMTLTKHLQLDALPRRATIYATSLGLYRIRVDAPQRDEPALVPIWTDFRKRVEFQTIEIPKRYLSRSFHILVDVGDGAFAGRIGLASIVPGGPSRGIYGREPRFAAQIEFELPSGAHQRVATDGTWKSSLDGPIRASDLLDGEEFDVARSDRRLARFDESSWPHAAVFSGGPAIVAPMCEPIRVLENLKPIAIRSTSDGRSVFDFGRNFVGWCDLRVPVRTKGDVTLRYGEMVDDAGSLYTANLRGAAQTDRFTLSGDDWPKNLVSDIGMPDRRALEPHFTTHGFRYVEVSGLPNAPAANEIVAKRIGIDARETGSFTCSNPMLNQLWQNILATQRSNLATGIPTDCPQRDERLGWMGDIQVFAQTACYQMDLAAFFTKWLQDVRDAQADDGRFPDFAPHPFDPNARFSGAPGWADAGVFVPWTAWVNYGDRKVLGESFDSARRWIEFVRAKNPDLVWREARGNDYGDWLNGEAIVAEGWKREGCAVPKELFATAFFEHSTRLASKMASALEKRDDAERLAQLADSIRAAFLKTFVTDADGTLTGDTQAGYALALEFELLPANLRDHAVARIVEDVRARGLHLSTGIQTTHRALLALSHNGEHELACRLALSTSFPSWGYMIDQGATTIWERWDGYVKGRGFQDPGMNSMNHWAFGAIGEWMMRTLAGIEPDEAHPGWEHFFIRPMLGGDLTFVDATYHSPRGDIRVAWKHAKGDLGESAECEVTIPPNTTATVVWPDVTRFEAHRRPVELAAGRHSFGVGRIR